MANMKAMTLDANLGDMQAASIASMDTFGQTFSSILVAFQRQINKDAELDDKLSGLCQRVDGIDSALVRMQQSIESAAQLTEQKLQQQTAQTQNRLAEMTNTMEQMTANLQRQQSELERSVSLRMNESSQDGANVQRELEAMSVSLQSTQNRVSTTLQSVDAKQEDIESQLEETRSTMTDSIETMTATIADNKSEAMERIGSISKSFASLRFEVDTLASTKADIADLTRKADKAPFKALQGTVNAMATTLGAEIEGIHNAMSAEHAKVAQSLCEQKEVAEERLKVVDAEISRVHSSVGALEYANRQRDDGQKQQAQLTSMVEQLSKEMDAVVEASGNKPAPMGATASGSCFSCGQRVTNSFPALPSRHRSPDKKNIGGGFTFENDPSSPKTRGSKKLSETMRRELANIAVELDSPGGKRIRVHTHSKMTIEKKAHKLPSLRHSATTPRL